MEGKAFLGSGIIVQKKKNYVSLKAWVSAKSNVIGSC